jgi:hypothetical protein
MATSTVSVESMKQAMMTPLVPSPNSGNPRLQINTDSAIDRFISARTDELMSDGISWRSAVSRACHEMFHEGSDGYAV